MSLGASLLGALVSWGAVWLTFAMKVAVFCPPHWEQMWGETWKNGLLLLIASSVTAIFITFATVFTVMSFVQAIRKFLLRRPVPWFE